MNFFKKINSPNSYTCSIFQKWCYVVKYFSVLVAGLTSKWYRFDYKEKRASNMCWFKPGVQHGMTAIIKSIVSPEKGAGSWRDAHLDTSYKGFFYIYTYIYICVCVHIKEQSLCLNTSDWSEQQTQLQIAFLRQRTVCFGWIVPVLAAIIRNSYAVLSWDCCLFNIGVAQSASHQVQPSA